MNRTGNRGLIFPCFRSRHDLPHPRGTADARREYGIALEASWSGVREKAYSLFWQTALGMIVKDTADNLAGCIGLDEVSIAKLFQSDQGLPSRPAAGALPGRRIERNS
jgi:hypothetical protein